MIRLVLAIVTINTVFSAGNCSAAFSVYWQSSTDTARWVDRGTSVAQTWNTQPLYMEAYPDSQRQTIEGFGGCFNEIEWTVLNTLSSTIRDSVIKSLYDSTAGCKFNMGRMSVGANDYSINYYSHDDSTGDYDMTAFSIARHKQYVIPFIKEAMKLRPDLKMWASPWTPPAWMKTNGNYAGGSITWTPQNLQAYALYLEKSVRAYQAEGLNLTAIFVQNEPWSNSVYPTCTWTPAQLRDIVKDYVGPQFRKNNVPVQLWLSTINNSNFSTAVEPSLSDSVCRSFLSGVGYQWEGYDAMDAHYQKYPSVPFWQTETKCGNGTNDWAYAEDQFNDRKNAFDRGAKAFFEWNMVLEKGGKSTWGWVQSSLISVDTVLKRVTYNPQYYVSKHFSFYVKPGARYIKMGGNYSDKVGFINTNGDVVIVVRNSSTTSYVTGIKVDNQMFLPMIPGKSFNTFVFTGVRPPPVSIRNPEQKIFQAHSSRIINKKGPATNIVVYDLQGKKLFSSGNINDEMDERNIQACLLQSLRGISVSENVVIIKLFGKNSVTQFKLKL
jgi:glucosylceramidase